MDKYREGILESTKIITQDTTFGLGFIPTRIDFQAMIAQKKREKMRARATR